MTSGTLFGLFFSISLIASARAEQASGDAGVTLYAAQAALLALGALFTLVWSYRAFNDPPIKLDDGPTLPRYMTQPAQYRAGAIGFSVICLLIYSLITYYHRELFPLIKYISGPLYEEIQKSTSDGSLNYPLAVIFAAAAFVALLKLDREWNPLLLLRGVIHGWVSIPQLAGTLMELARDELTVPTDLRPRVVADHNVEGVAIDDFDKGRRSLDRHWAELSYIRYWLRNYQEQGSHLTFFAEPCFAWRELQANYDDVCARIMPLKRGSVTDPSVFSDVAEKVDALRKTFCRLAACFLVFKNETTKAAFADARHFGIPVPNDTERASPLRYIPIYLVALVFGVYVGVLATAAAWDLTHGYGDRAFAQDPDITTRWVLFALSNYGTAILSVLVVRYLGWRTDPSQPGSYLVSYAFFFLLSLAVSIPFLSLAVHLLTNNPAIAQMQFAKLLFTQSKWAVSPAVLTVIVVHSLDRHIDPLLPDVAVAGKWPITGSIARSFCCAVLVTVFTVEPALSIPLDSAGSVSQADVWEAAKLRVVVLGTTFSITFFLSLAGEFLFGKSRTIA